MGRLAVPRGQNRLCRLAVEIGEGFEKPLRMPRRNARNAPRRRALTAASLPPNRIRSSSDMQGKSALNREKFIDFFTLHEILPQIFTGSRP